MAATRRGGRRLRLPVLALLSIVASLVASALAIELSLRLLGWYTPASVHLPAANESLRDVQTEWDVTYRTNALGLRGELPPVERPNEGGVPRVALIGDSFVFGQGVELAEALPAALGQRLAEMGHPIEVINLSAIAIGPEAYYVLLRDVALRHRPDVVVLAVFGNDASLGVDASWRRQLVRSLSRHLHLVALPRVVHRERAKRRNIRVTSDPGTYWGRLTDECARRHGRAECETLVRSFRERHGSRVNNLVTACLTDPDEVRRWIYTDEEGPGWSEFRHFVVEMARLCRSRSTPLVLALVPEGAQVDPEHAELRRTLGVELPASVMTAKGPFQGLACGLAHELDLGCVDPLERFREHPEGLYFASDVHWTPAGHRLFAGELADYLVRERLLDLR